MAIYGNMVGSSGWIVGKTVEIISDDWTVLMGVVVDQEQILDAKPSDVRIGKKVVSDSGVIEGTNTITYRTRKMSYLIFPGEDFSIPIEDHDLYNYTKAQCIIAKFNTTILQSVEVNMIVLENNVYNVNSTQVLSSITKNTNTKSIDLNITNNTDDTYVVHLFAYKEEE